MSEQNFISIVGLILPQGVIYQGDMQDGDRVATDAEVQAWQAANAVASAPQVISDRQFFQQLAATPDPNNAGSTIISQTDALAAVSLGAIPPAMAPLISSLPADQQFAAKMKIAGATSFDIADPITLAIAQSYGWSTPQLAAFWSAAAAL